MGAPDAAASAAEGAAAPAVMLRAEGVSLGYGATTIVDALTVSVPRGQILALTGENGSGKSTLLRGLAGLQPMACAAYELAGASDSVNSARHRRLTFAIMDHHAWLRDLTLADHLHAVHAPGDSAMAPGEALEVLGLGALAARPPHALSSGQRQRAALALACVRPWSVLFLDEPEQRLDARYGPVVAGVLRRLVGTGSRAIVMATHAPGFRAECGAREFPMPGGGEG
ncbi:MAG: ABC transporter ATP-binding protein [Dermabacter sp.]|nr:ABC transporter ATP-binding protein [Dermabacter sp.]